MKKSNKSKSMPRRQSKQRESNEGSNNELHELFLEDLADVHNAEKQLLKALPKMARAAQSPELREAFEMHLTETENQISRIEEAVESLGESLKRKKCKGMEGLIEEGEEMMEEKADSPAIDAALIAAAQKVEHYEIATYGTLCTWAELMGHEEALQLLKENLAEEEAADKKLTGIAESAANQMAQQSE